MNCLETAQKLHFEKLADFEKRVDGKVDKSDISRIEAAASNFELLEHRCRLFSTANWKSYENINQGFVAKQVEEHNIEFSFAVLVVLLVALCLSKQFQGFCVHPCMGLFSPTVHYISHIVCIEYEQLSFASTTITFGSKPGNVVRTLCLRHRK